MTTRLMKRFCRWSIYSTLRHTGAMHAPDTTYGGTRCLLSMGCSMLPNPKPDSLTGTHMCRGFTQVCRWCPLLDSLIRSRRWVGLQAAWIRAVQIATQDRLPTLRGATGNSTSADHGPNYAAEPPSPLAAFQLSLLQCTACATSSQFPCPTSIALSDHGSFSVCSQCGNLFARIGGGVALFDAALRRPSMWCGCLAM